MLSTVLMGNIPSGPGRAADRPLPVPVNVQAFLDRLRPNTGLIPGPKSGWLLGNMSFIGASQIGSRAVGLIAGPKLFFALLDLRTGDVEKLGAAEEDELYKSAAPFRLTNASQVIHMSQPDVSTSHIQGGAHCTPPFDEYAIVHPRGSGVSRSFFVVGLLPQPALQHVPICVEGAPPDHGNIRSRAFDVIPIPFELSDGSVFVWLDLFEPGQIKEGLLRLDDQAREHSTLGGEIYLLDTKPIQDGVSTADANGDLNALWTVIRQALLKQHNIKVE